MDRDTALHRLPEVYAQVLRLCERNLAEDDIGRALGVEPEAVGPLIAIASAKLKRLLEEPFRSADASQASLDGDPARMD